MVSPTSSRLLFLVGSIALIAVATHASIAAGPDPDDPATPTQLASIVVTAQKRGQSIEAVPLAITAYSGAFLESLGISRYEDLAPLVPGLFIAAQSPNFPSINVRGVGSDTLDPRHEARISVFQDGVAISRAPGAATELFDLERVEVLKGPQGTLFGRSAAAGAISLISRKPSVATAASLTLGIGNFDRRHASGFVNTPLAGDRLLGRLAFTAEHRSGHVDNLLDGSDLNSRETVAIRPSLRWIPNLDTTVDLVFNFQRDTPAGTAFKSGVIPTSRGDTDPYAPAELTRGAALGLDRTVWGATLLFTHALSDAWTLHTTTAWRAFDAHENFDADGAAPFLLETSDSSTGRQVSQEVRVNFDADGRLSGFLGATLSRERGRQHDHVRVDERRVWPFLAGNFREGLLSAGVPASIANTVAPPMHPLLPQSTLPAGFAAFAFVPPLANLAALAGTPLKPLHVDQYVNRAGFDAADLFADGTWRITDRLEFTTGARVSFEEQTAGYEVPVSSPPSTLGFLLAGGPNFAVAPTAGPLADHDRTTGWAARAIARYIVDPELNVYASVSRGRRPATILITATDRTRTSEESIVNTELGAKGRALGGRLAWSAAAFLYRYGHFQTLVQDPANIARFIIVDAGRATGRGGELSGRAMFSDTLSAFATYGYTDATFDDTDDRGLPQRYAGSTFRLTARHTASLGVTFEHDAGRRGHFAFTPVWQYKSAHYFEDDNTALGGTLRQPGFSLVNLRLAWRSPDRSWEAVIFADNLLAKEYLIDAGNIGGSFGLPTFIRGAPRQLGINVTRHW